MPKHILGIGLEATGITLVRLSGSLKSYEVTLATHHALPQHDDLQEQATLQQEAVHAILAPLQAHGDTVLVALPASHAVLRNLVFPFKEPRRIYQVLANSLDEHMPFDPEDVVVDFQALPSAKATDTRVLVAGMPEAVIASALALCQGEGLEPTVLDLDVCGLANAVLLGGPPLPTRTVLIDVHHERVLLTLLDHGTPVFARSLAYGLDPEAEDIAGYVGRLSKHLQQTFYACDNVLGHSYEPELLVVSGGYGVQAMQVAYALQEALEIPANVWRVAAPALKVGSGRGAVPELGRYAVAFGMALRGLQRRAFGMNFRRERFALYKDRQALRGPLIVLWCILAVALGLGITTLSLSTHYKAQRYARLQEDISQAFRDTLPGTRLVQPTVQLREKLRELEERLKAFGGMSGAQLSGLQILHEISARTPPTLTLNVDTIAITTGATDFGGSTDSYDDVVKLKNALEASPFFPVVKITNTKTDVGDKISFKMTINTSKTPGGSS